MNIEKLEAILQEMRNAAFSDLSLAQSGIRAWAIRIEGAITEHLLAELGAADSAGSGAGLELGSSARSGHGWDDDGTWRGK